MSETRTDSASGRLWETLALATMWVRFADAKAGAILAGNLALVAVVATVLGQFPDPFDHRPWLVGLLSLSIVTGGASALAAGSCLLPNVSLRPPRKRVRDVNSVVFFGDVVKFGNAEDYTKEAVEVHSSDEHYCAHVGFQIFVNSELAVRKFKSADTAVRLFMVTIVILCTAALLAAVKEV